MFQIGKDVVCIEAFPPEHLTMFPCITELPQLNRVYEVHDISKVWGDGGLGLDLVECRIVRCSCEGAVVWWDAAHFRPVKDTSIDIFTKAPAPLEPVDA